VLKTGLIFLFRSQYELGSNRFAVATLSQTHKFFSQLDASQICTVQICRSTHNDDRLFNLLLNPPLEPVQGLFRP
jgi:hypothetical protein